MDHALQMRSAGSGQALGHPYRGKQNTQSKEKDFVHFVYLAMRRFGQSGTELML